MWIDYYTHEILCLTCWIFHKILSGESFLVPLGKCCSSSSALPRVNNNNNGQKIYILYSFSGYNIFSYVCNIKHRLSMFPVKWNKLQLTVEINFSCCVYENVCCLLSSFKGTTSTTTTTRTRKRLEEGRERFKHRWKFSSWSNESVFICMRRFVLRKIIARCDEKRGKWVERNSFLSILCLMFCLLTRRYFYAIGRKRDAFHPRENIFGESFWKKGKMLCEGGNFSFAMKRKIRSSKSPTRRRETWICQFQSLRHKFLLVSTDSITRFPNCQQRKWQIIERTSDFHRNRRKKFDEFLVNCFSIDNKRFKQLEGWAIPPTISKRQKENEQTES